MVGVEEGREFRFRGDLYSQDSTLPPVSFAFVNPPLAFYIYFQLFVYYITNGAGGILRTSCLSVCMSVNLHVVRKHISETGCPNFTKFCVRVGRSSILSGGVAVRYVKKVAHTRLPSVGFWT